MLFAACPNPRLLALVESEWVRLGHLRDSTFSFVPGRAQESVREHETLLDLIEAGAPLADIERAARGHRSATLAAYLSHEHPDEAPATRRDDRTLRGDRMPADLPERLQHYIGGEHVDSADGATFEVLDPVSNETYLHAAAGKAADVDRAVAAARHAFEEGPWPRMLPRERSRVLHRVADIVESRDARLAELESFDSGLPITQALGQARRAAENFRFFADLVVAQTDDAFKVPGRQLNYVNRKPIGVAGLITPWNTPFMLESWKLGPALATGNTVVLKPAEFTPALGVPVGRDLRGGRPARRACSTSSTGSARRRATRWSSTRTSR